MSENKSGIRFIRVNGRVVPIKQKTYVGTKTVDRSVGTRAASGAKTGATAGAAFGSVVGLLHGKTVAGKLLNAANRGAGTALVWGAAGAALGAAFGKRKGLKKVKKKKFSSV